MKTTNLFDLGYLDLFKALFFGKKLRLVPDARMFSRDVTSSAQGEVSCAQDTVETNYYTANNFDSSRDTWRVWLDPYHVNPFTENPFDRV